MSIATLTTRIPHQALGAVRPASRGANVPAELFPDTGRLPAAGRAASSAPAPVVRERRRLVAGSGLDRRGGDGYADELSQEVSV